LLNSENMVILTMNLMALQKVHLLRYAQASSLRRTFQVRLILQLSQALHLELFALPSR
jgi:hypothetical protein